MNFLIDTNIIIQLEDDRIIDEVFSKFYSLAISNNCKVLLHPEAVKNDINQDANKTRKEIILSKIKKYEKLENFSIPDKVFLEKICNNKINDKIDNQQLYQVFKGFVDYFITQDRGIHHKAKIHNISDYVLKIRDAVQLLEKLYTIKIPEHPILESYSVRKLENYFNSPFFDSFREDYGEESFKKWFNKCLKEDRKCYSLISKNELLAILIYNKENIEDHKLPGIFEPVLKICTLKVSNDLFGIKLGELFLNKMFEYCINQNINYLYVTAYEKQTELLRLLLKFGFKKYKFINSQNLEELRIIKCMNKSKVDLKENSILIHPFYFDNTNIQKFAIPIKPKYYQTLFKDGKLRNPTLFDKEFNSLSEIQGNTIIKAYISNSRITKMNKGDILFFYSSKKNQVIEPIGILESIQLVNDFEKLLKIVRKKTVFSHEELKEMLSQKGKLHVIIFRLITYMNKKIDLKKIQQIDSFRNKIQTITRLKEDDYKGLKNEGYFDKRFIIN